MADAVPNPLDHINYHLRANDFGAQTILAAAADNTPAALTVPERTLVGRVTGGAVGAVTMAQGLAMIPSTTTAPLGAELGSGSGLSQTVTTVVGQSYQAGGSGVTAITLDGAGLVVSNNYSSFVATSTSHALVGTGGSVLSVKQITGATVADVTLAGMPVRCYGELFSSGIGTDAQRSLTTGSSNSAIGYNAQRSLTTGSYNSAVGDSAQYSLTTGSSNSAIGASAQRFLTTGLYNSAVGDSAQYSLTTGSSNTAIGQGAQRSLTTGSDNTAIGYAAQYALTTGSSNTAIGFMAHYSMTTGSSSTGFGYQSQRYLTSGSGNTAMGYAAQSAPKGISANATTASSLQTAVGHESGQFSAGTGDRGCALGYRALYHTGAVALGSDSEAQGVNSIAIGRAAIATVDNTIQIGATTIAYTLSFGNKGRVIGLTEFKSLVSAAADWAAFKIAVAALS